MKKNLTLITLLVLTTLFNACGSKVPFSLEKPLPDSALVYVYFPQHVATDESSHESEYNIFFNDRRVMDTIFVNEYMVFHVKPGNVEISLARKQIEEKAINLNLKSGTTYYLKIMDNIAGNQFDFVQVNKRVALSEIVNTGLSGTSVSSPDNIINVFADTPKEKAVLAEPAVQTVSKISKMDEIQKAYEMKEKGILSETEFNSLKAEILAK